VPLYILSLVCSFLTGRHPFRFTVVPDVLGPELLQELRDYFDEVEARLTGGEEVEYCFRSEHGDVQINHLPLHRPSFRQLLAPPRAFPLVRKAMHAKYGEEPTFLDMADGLCPDAIAQPNSTFPSL
jgi:hypothetical protein